MRKYNEGQKSSSKRFCKPNRMMLVQADIKYGPKLPIGKNGKKVQTYLSSIIDDHSRYILASAFYDNQEKEIVEEVVDRAPRTIQSSTGETMKGLAGERVKVRMSESVRRVLDPAFREGKK